MKKNKCPIICCEACEYDPSLTLKERRRKEAQDLAENFQTPGLTEKERNEEIARINGFVDMGGVVEALVERDMKKKSWLYRVYHFFNLI